MTNEALFLNTKKALAAALKEAMEKKPLSKVTVSELSTVCKINRKTFYYHFRDLYDLLKWMLEQETIEVIKNFDFIVNTEEAIRGEKHMIRNKKESLASAIVSIVLGVLLILLKNNVISIALTVFGVCLLISAILDFTHKMTNFGIIKAVVGACVLIFGWVFVNVALYLLAAAIIMIGLLQIVNLHKFVPVNFTATQKILMYVKPVATVIAGGCLLFNQGGTIAWVFILTGVLLVIEGVLELVLPNENGG